MDLAEIKRYLGLLSSTELAELQDCLIDRWDSLALDGEATDDGETLVVRSREIDNPRKPGLKQSESVLLYEGERVRKEALIWKIVDHKTNELHHYSLKLTTSAKDGTGTWKQTSVSLNDRDGIAIEKLVTLLGAYYQIDGSGQFVVTRNNGPQYSRLLKAVTSSPHMRGLIEDILSWINEKPEAIVQLCDFASQNPERSERLTAALNYGRYVAKLQEFRDLVEGDKEERFYQAFLTENDWLFGSEYREIHDVRTLVAGIQLDFPLRRTVDGRLEILEIKRPTKDTLFRDDNHLSPKGPLFEAIAQVAHYFEELDRSYYELRDKYGIQVDRAKARIIIGRDGSPTQQRALQRMNSVLNRVEVITFDQLLEIGQRTVSLVQSKQYSEPESVRDLGVDIPF